MCIMEAQATPSDMFGKTEKCTSKVITGRLSKASATMQTKMWFIL